MIASTDAEPGEPTAEKWYSTAQAATRFTPAIAPRTMRVCAADARHDPARVRQKRRGSSLSYELSETYLREIATQKGWQLGDTTDGGRDTERAGQDAEPAGNSGAECAPKPGTDAAIISEMRGRIADLQEALRHEKESHKRAEMLHAGSLPELTRWRERAEQAENELRQIAAYTGNDGGRAGHDAEPTGNEQKPTPRPWWQKLWAKK
ncbi:MAG: hypothetical protein H7Y38_14505 [Armatimonadetes bacterium]|nr:hypothetical protein [Armatimonadota bacterium]